MTINAAYTYLKKKVLDGFHREKQWHDLLDATKGRP
jgi:hypothetical protein